MRMVDRPHDDEAMAPRRTGALDDGTVGPQGAALILELQRLRRAFELENLDEGHPPQHRPPRTLHGHGEVLLNRQVAEQQLAGLTVGAAVLEHDANAGAVAAGTLELAALDRLAKTQHIGRALREVHVHGVDLLDDGELRRLAAALNEAQLAFTS